jgi:ABC-type polysaccharide/polyol phosphate transport system ATPase subunit
MIKLSGVTLTYELYHDQTRSLKEAVINLFHRRSYTKEKKSDFNALNNLTFEVKEGERLGIVGGNGAGKSTLLKVISGILKPTKGSVKVNGNIQPLIEISAGFNPEFSGKENIYLNGYMLGFSRDQIQAKEKEIIDFTELGDFINVPVKYYSSGMSVRLAFAIATSIEPEILLFDEMLSAGDAHFASKAQHRMDSLLKKSKGMVIVSHDLAYIEKLCSRVIWLSHGTIMMDGIPKDVVKAYSAS